MSPLPGHPVFLQALSRGCSALCVLLHFLTALALAVACRDIDVRNVKAMIIGPHETPYEFGFFEVSPADAVYVPLFRRS